MEHDEIVITTQRFKGRWYHVPRWWWMKRHWHDPEWWYPPVEDRWDD